MMSKMEPISNNYRHVPITTLSLQVSDNKKLKERCAHLEALLDDEDVDIQEVLELIHRIAPNTSNGVSPQTSKQIISPKSVATK